MSLKNQYFDCRHGPVIIRESGNLPIDSGKATFVLVCGANFNQRIPNAATTCRMGWCRGFEKIGIPYILVSVFELAERLPELHNPICWIAGGDYSFLTKKNLHSLKATPHAVWVGTSFSGDSDFFDSRKWPNVSDDNKLKKKILSSEPGLLFTISPESGFHYYEGWINEGVRLVSLPLACDCELYNKNVVYIPKFENVDMAFVGGYWEYKAKQFDRYLKPYKDWLRVYGYSPWPYGQYGGLLPDTEEAALYKQAKVSPIINEPHVSQMSIDINERVFKVLGSGGLGVTDVTPAYREWFSSDELLVPETIDGYHELIRDVLSYPQRYVRYREAGMKAVIERHTYAHRAKALLSLLKINQIYNDKE